MCDCHMPKHFLAMACNSKSHVIVIMWHVINMKLNIGKKITGFNDTESRKIQNISKFIELMYKGKSQCLQEYFRNQRTFKLV